MAGSIDLGTSPTILDIAGELSGTEGIPTFPAAAAAANSVSLAEVLRYISEHQNTWMVNRTTETVPASTSQELFDVAGGNILLLGIVGEVTTVIQSQADAMKLTWNPATGASTDLCTQLDINGHAAGTFYSITGTVTDPLQNGIAMVHAMASPIVLGIGGIDLACNATNTGAIEWHLLYKRIDTAAVVTATAAP
jgi:hypothetical protein